MSLQDVEAMKCSSFELTFCELKAFHFARGELSFLMVK